MKTYPKSAIILEIIKKYNLLQENVLAHNEFSIASLPKNKILAYLIEQHQLSPIRLAQTCAQFFNCDFYELSAFEKKSMPQKYLFYFLDKNQLAFPLEILNNNLTVAIADPEDYHCLDEWRFQTGCNITIVFSPHDQLQKLVNKFKSEKYYAALDSHSTIAFVQQLLTDAIHQQASDVHFEAFNTYFRIRMRIDGLLYEITRQSLDTMPAIVSRIKILAELDIAEKRLPQDGRFSFLSPDGQKRDCRVSICPTIFGEKIVIRILDANTKLLSLEDLGFDQKAKELFIKTIEKPQGLILVTGPTGSGKTLTLYTALKYLNHISKNISTIEDPVEIQLAGINQVNVNYKIGLNFANALKTFLRQDPDIIMVGEIRDKETAEIAIRASQTGHLVITTLHTNSAAETLMRLINMGIELVNIISSIHLIMAQRLVRKLCVRCKINQASNKNFFIKHGFRAEQIPRCIFAPKGCRYCKQGYQGRIAIFEMMRMSTHLMELILNKASQADIQKLAQTEGMLSLLQAGLEKVINGITDITEIYRVVSF